MTGTVTLGVVAYRDVEELEQCLMSAAGLPVIVANVSADAAVAVAARRHGAQVVNLEGNRGFAAGVNALARICPTEWLLVTNDDVEYLTGLEAGLARLEREDADVGVPTLVGLDGRPQRSLRSLPTPSRFLLEWVLAPDRPLFGFTGGMVRKWATPDAESRVEAATGAALLVRAELLRQVPMDEGFFMYWEEIDWFWRLRDAGCGVAAIPDLVMRRPEGRHELGEAKWRWIGGNLVRLGRARYGPPGALVYFALALLWLARLAFTDAFASDRTVRWSARRAGLRGASRALASGG